MRKILLIILFASVAMLFSVKNVSAQGTFNCTQIALRCDVGTNSCTSGYEPNSSYCSGRNYGGDCTNAPSAPCIQTKVDSKSAPYICADGLSVKTAIGCIPINNTDALVGFVLRWAIGIAGGIAFLLILVAGFQIMTARGDPKRLQAGQELLTSAIGGILLLIFSVFLLRVIGVNILNISEF